MNRAIEQATLEGSVHLLLAGLLLIASSLAGVGGSVVVLASMVLIAVVLAATRHRIAALVDGAWVGYLSVDRVLESVWVAPALAATTVAVGWGATPGELQSLGGLLGLAGIGNYFLRPVYLTAFDRVSPTPSETGTGSDRS